MSEKLTVAELLARNAKEGGGRSRRNAERPRRHRDLDQGGISVSELTGDIPVVVVDEDGRPTGPDPEYREHDARHGGPGAAETTDGADSTDNAGGAGAAAAADATGTTDRTQAPAQEPAPRAASATTGTFVASDSTLVPNRPVAGGDDWAADSDDVAETADTADSAESAESAESADSVDREQADAATAVAPLVTPDAVLAASEYDDNVDSVDRDAEVQDVAATDRDGDAGDPTVTTSLAAQPDETAKAAGAAGTAEAAGATAGETAAAPAAAAAAETVHGDDEIVEYEDDTISWGALIGQALGAVVLGVLIFFGFTVLWNHLATVLVLVMALIVTLVVVGLVHALLRHRDTLILALAFIVGLALTLGPRLIMSI